MSTLLTTALTFVFVTFSRVKFANVYLILHSSERKFKYIL